MICKGIVAITYIKLTNSVGGEPQLKEKALQERLSDTKQASNK